MNPNTAPHHTRSIGIILLVISLFTGLLGMGMTMPAPEAQAANLTMSDNMIDSFTARIHRADMEAGQFEDLADGATVSVYDTIRWQLGFNIPAGTLNETNPTLQTYLELDGSRDNWLNLQSNLYGTWIGTIMVNGEQAGDYQIRILNPNYDGNDTVEVHTGYRPPVKDDLYRYRIRIRFTFNKEFINRNQTMPINDGTLWFDQDAYWLGTDGATPTIGVGGHTMGLTVQGMHATLDKEAIGEPVYNPKTGLVEQKWRITVANDGSMDLPSGWKLADTMYKNDAPASIRDNRGSIASGGFACALSTKAGNTCSQSYPSSLVQPAITGYRPGSYSVRVGTQYWFFVGSNGSYEATLNKPSSNSSAMSLNQLGDFYHHSEMWTMDTLKAGDTIMYEYTSHSPWSDEYDHVTNRVILHPNSKYYPEILSDTAQYAMPDKGAGTPYLRTSKSYGSSKTIGDCLEGENGCLMQSTWTTVIENTGDGDQQPPWQIVDQLNRNGISASPCSPGTKYSWFRREDIQQMIDNLKAQGFDAELDAVETCTTTNAGETPNPANGWHDVDDLDDLDGLYESRSVVGTKLRINTVLKAGGAISIEYNSTSQGHGYVGERRYYNAAQACSWINDNWVCYPGTTTSNVRTIQQLRKSCGGYYGDSYSYNTSVYDGKRWWLGLETEQTTHKAELGSCGIQADIAPADRGKPVTFHETMTALESRSNGIPKGFTLVGNTNRICNPNSTNNATCWGIEAPTVIGQRVSKTVNNGATTITITKTGEGEWDITFHTPERNTNYWSSILFYVVYQNKDFDETSWKDVNQNGRIEHSIGGRNTVRAVVANGVMDLTASDYWWHYRYDNGSVTAAKTKISHAPEGASGTKVAYKTGFNPNAIDLNPDGITVSLTDTVTGLTDKDTVALMPGSVVVKYLSEPQTQSLSWDYGGNWGNPGSLHGKSNGYGYYYTYSNIPSTPPSNARTLDPSMYTARWDAATSTLTVDGLPDHVRIWVEYALVYNSVNTQLTNIMNTAMLTVDGEQVDTIQSASTTNTFPIYKSAAVAKIQGVYLKKTDNEDTTRLLADAQFDLQRWDGTQYVHDRTITTSDTVASVVDKLECGTAYRLTEQEAPTGYKLDTTPYDFALKACEAPTNLKPDGWHGVEHITMDTITRTNQRIPAKHTMPTTGQGVWLSILLGISLTTMIGGIIILARNGRK